MSALKQYDKQGSYHVNISGATQNSLNRHYISLCFSVVLCDHCGALYEQESHNSTIDINISSTCLFANINITSSVACLNLDTILLFSGTVVEDGSANYKKNYFDDIRLHLFRWPINKVQVYQ